MVAEERGFDEVDDGVLFVIELIEGFEVQPEVGGDETALVLVEPQARRRSLRERRRGAPYKFEWSPDVYFEQEILIRRPVRGAEVWWLP